MPQTMPTRALLDISEAACAEVASLYPHDTARAQRVLAEACVEVLLADGHDADPGWCGEHRSAEIRLPLARLLLVPMAGLADLNAELAIEDDADPGLWHLLARDHAGRLLAPGLGTHSCPSVLLTVRAGVDPVAAPAVLAVALADRDIAALLGGPP